MSTQRTDLSTGCHKYRRINPVEEIRVIKLEPASSFDDPLVIELPTFTISTHNRYDCVSYCWGGLRDSVTLECENQWLSVSSNVESILRHLRKAIKPRYLWIDAICINQEDDQEKAIQVQQMFKIFKFAFKVHVWLGEAQEEHQIHRVFSFLRDVSLDLLTEAEVTREKFQPILIAIANFLERPWFMRRWIIQELASAHVAIFHCGNYHMSWNWIRPALGTLFGSYKKTVQPFLQSRLCTETLLAIEGVISLKSNEHKSTPQGMLLNLLWNHHVSECKDERDRLFALYGISDSWLLNPSQNCPVDYSKHFRTVYTQLAQESIKRGFFKDWLSHIFAFGNLSQQNADWPSWVPSWNKQRDVAEEKVSDLEFDYEIKFSRIAFRKIWDVLEVESVLGQITAIQRCESIAGLVQFFELRSSKVWVSARSMKHLVLEMVICYRKTWGVKANDQLPAQMKTTERAELLINAVHPWQFYDFIEKYPEVPQGCVAFCVKVHGFEIPGITFADIKFGDCVLLLQTHSSDWHGLERTLLLRPATELPFGRFRNIGTCLHGILLDGSPISQNPSLDSFSLLENSGKSQESQLEYVRII